MVLTGIELNKLEKITEHSPSQWVGYTKDKNIVYIRYRHGMLYVGIGKKIKEAIENIVLEKAIGDNSYMDTKTMLNITGLVVINKEGRAI